MLLMDALNNSLSMLPDEVKLLERQIEATGWSDVRKGYALKIVHQMNRPKLDGFTDMTLYKVRLNPLSLTLSPSEIEIISKAKDLEAVGEYINDILKDVNNMSRLVYLRYGGHDFTSDYLKYSIDWNI